MGPDGMIDERSGGEISHKHFIFLWWAQSRAAKYPPSLSAEGGMKRSPLKASVEDRDVKALSNNATN